ncbi:MAG: hypothetical protein PVI03_06840, partial [Candidatus Thorarchaeota archaeon]
PVLTIVTGRTGGTPASLVARYTEDSLLSTSSGVGTEALFIVPVLAISIQINQVRLLTRP